MIFKRWYREVGGLAAFLLIFYAAVVWTNGASEDEQSSDINASQMTKSRRYSDAAFREGDFADASLHLEDMLVTDPHNSHARFLLAKCYHHRCLGIYHRLHDHEDNETAVSDPEQLESLESEYKALGDQAIQLYRRCTKSHRYRGDALLYLSALSGLRKDRVETLASLKRFLSLNDPTNNGIAQIPEFAFLLDDSEFQELIVVEQKIKRENRRR